MLISGQCQCGNISFNLEWLPDPTRIPAWACTCSFCRTHKGVWTSSPSVDLKVQINDLKQITQHTFGTRTADFLICKQCEDIPLVTSEIDGRLYAVVNVHALHGISPTLFKHLPSDFDGESVDERTKRRRQNWIPNVTITSSLKE
jgi:hypothetical protein